MVTQYQNALNTVFIANIFWKSVFHVDAKRIPIRKKSHCAKRIAMARKKTLRKYSKRTLKGRKFLHSLWKTQPKTIAQFL